MIPGLDPAKPWFMSDDERVRIGSGDAIFVDNMHTDSGSAGMGKATADADFFPNKGYTQAGCEGVGDTGV